MDIQAAINALPPTGGVVNIPAGRHPGPRLVMRNHVKLVGESWFTVIPGIQGQNTRHFGFGLENLVVDGSLSGALDYGIDWRNVTKGFIQHVAVTHATHGMILYGEAECNTIIDLSTPSDALVGIEITGGANQNTFIGGKASASGTCLTLVGANGNTFTGTSLESGNPSAVFRNMSDAAGSAFLGVRTEKPGYGPIWLNEITDHEGALRQMT